MRMEQLLYLIEISKNKSMNIACQNIHISPQALNISIKKLEEELGVQLLVRTNKGSRLTEKGWALVDATEKYLQDIDRLVYGDSMETKFSGILDYNGSIDVYSNYGGSNLFLPKLVSYFYKYNPKLNFSIHSMSYSEIIKKVHNNMLEYAFFNQFYQKNVAQIHLPRNVSFFPLFRNQLILQVPDNFPIYKYDFLTLDEVIRYPLIKVPNMRTSDPDPLLNGIFDTYGNFPKSYYADTPAMAKELLCSGLGVYLNIVTPYQDINRFYLKNVKAIPVVADIEIHFGYISKSKILSEKNGVLLDYIIDHLLDILQFNIE